jgi:hypothetical protein
MRAFASTAASSLFSLSLETHTYGWVGMLARRLLGLCSVFLYTGGGSVLEFEDA